MSYNKNYKVGIYLRVSRDDRLIADRESNSITSQRAIISNYISKQNDMTVYDTYVDEGSSGTNFDRVGFIQMMKDIENKKINCVIVKDLSRLGRDYIEVGRLVQIVFPTYFVRFIAVTDNFDSLVSDYNEEAFVVPMKNFINDAYARDISIKVRSSQQIKREKGEHIGAFAIYGYTKSKENKNKLIIDDYAASIVKMIFGMKMKGYSSLAIAKSLNYNGILSPLEYKNIKGEHLKTGFAVNVNPNWSVVAVNRILTDESYIGTLIQGKHQKVNYKLKNVYIKDENEWTKVPNCHKAIISKEDYMLVKELLTTSTRVSSCNRMSHIYTGILFCGDCNKPMVRRINKYKDKNKVSYICSTNNKTSKCKRHMILEDTLNEIVITLIRKEIAKLDKEDILSYLEYIKMDVKDIYIMKNEVKKLYDEQKKCLIMLSSLNDNWNNGIITSDEYEEFVMDYEERLNGIIKRISKQNIYVKELVKAYNKENDELEELKANLDNVDIERLLVVTFIKSIRIFEDKKVSIEFRYK